MRPFPSREWTTTWCSSKVCPAPENREPQRFCSGRLPGSQLVSSQRIQLENGLLDLFSSEQRSTVQRLMAGSLYEKIAGGGRRLILDTNLISPEARAHLLDDLAQRRMDIYHFHLSAADRDLEERIRLKVADDPVYTRLGMDAPQILAEARRHFQPLSRPERRYLNASFSYDTSTNTLSIQARDGFFRYQAERIGEHLAAERPDLAIRRHPEESDT